MTTSEIRKQVSEAVDVLEARHGLTVLHTVLTGSRPRFGNSHSDYDVSMLYVHKDMADYFDIGHNPAGEIYLPKMFPDMDVRAYEITKWLPDACKTAQHTVDLTISPVVFSSMISEELNAIFRHPTTGSALFWQHRNRFSKIMHDEVGAASTGTKPKEVEVKATAEMLYCFWAGLYSLVTRKYPPYNATDLLDAVSSEDVVSKVISYGWSGNTPLEFASLKVLTADVFALRKVCTPGSLLPADLVNSLHTDYDWRAIYTATHVLGASVGAAPPEVIGAKTQVQVINEATALLQRLLRTQSSWKD